MLAFGFATRKIKADERVILLGGKYEIQINVKDLIKLSIQEHQLGTNLEEAHVEFAVMGKGSWSMDLSTFIKKITR